MYLDDASNRLERMMIVCPRNQLSLGGDDQRVDVENLDLDRPVGPQCNGPGLSEVEIEVARG